MGKWKFTECGFMKKVHLSSTVYKCPNCGAAYTEVRTIQPHLVHKVTITKSLTGKLNVNRPPRFFAINSRCMDDVDEYHRILKISETREDVRAQGERS